MAVSKERIAVHSLADLKNTSDDALPNYLNSIGFTQSHILADVRLGLGYTAFAICAATFYWDYKFGFEDTKVYTAIAVALYACINGALTFWIWGVEKGKVYVGTSKDGRKIEIASSTTKHSPVYNLIVTEYSSSSAMPVTTKITRPFSEWFDAAGHFVTLPFQEMLATKSPLIGSADPKRVASAKEAKAQARKEKYVVDDGKTLDDKWASLLAESSGVTADVSEDSGVGAKTTATPGGKAKRRGKKA